MRLLRNSQVGDEIAILIWIRETNLRLPSFQFAHRECVQRWCDEKGSNVCEICRQVFEPGYTFSEKKAMVDVVVTIRISHDAESHDFNDENSGGTGYNYVECSTSSQRGAIVCRSVAIMLTVMLLARNFFTVMMLGSGQYAFSILTSLWNYNSLLRGHEIDSNGSKSTTTVSARATSSKEFVPTVVKGKNK
ncbi:hypothetical protein ZIOFF_006092 [Zingiber officinale]|uniref:RING-CH-type domain-containing protein n=1 Tax=Zingiber officinale TaxID=94328 RepID=A0A8J5HRR3_ZINOF|nr:hypothetical protein ZIOFF_006092 [Zingiber officinale]